LGKGEKTEVTEDIYKKQKRMAEEKRKMTYRGQSWMTAGQRNGEINVDRISRREINRCMVTM